MALERQTKTHCHWVRTPHLKALNLEIMLGRQNQKLPEERELMIRQAAYRHFEITLNMLNESMLLCLPTKANAAEYVGEHQFNDEAFLKSH